PATFTLSLHDALPISHRQDLRLPLVDHRDADLVGHGVDDRSLLTVEKADHLEAGLRLAVFPGLRGLDAEDPTRFVIDDDVPVHRSEEHTSELQSLAYL